MTGSRGPRWPGISHHPRLYRGDNALPQRTRRPRVAAPGCPVRRFRRRLTPESKRVYAALAAAARRAPPPLHLRCRPAPAGIRAGKRVASRGFLPRAARVVALHPCNAAGLARWGPGFAVVRHPASWTSCLPSRLFRARWLGDMLLEIDTRNRFVSLLDVGGLV